MRHLTWPGSFFHELAHQLACYAVGHKVLEVRYVNRNRADSVAGYVVHQGPSGAFRELFIGIAPLMMGAAVWTTYIAMAALLTRDGKVSATEAAALLTSTLIAANATYHALPSTKDMEKVLRKPFKATSLPWYALAGAVWIAGHNYRCVLWGWTPWHILVTLTTLYALYAIVEGNMIPALPDPVLPGLISNRGLAS